MHPPADIVKMLDSQPDLAPLIRRVRGGYLKIQGTWMPYEVCELVATATRMIAHISQGCAALVSSVSLSS